MTTAYCSITDVQNRLSAEGVTLRTDDSPPTSYGEVITEASTEIDEYCLHRYTAANLAVSDWVRFRASVIAAVLLCERRGNPVPRSLEKRYDKLMERLEKVREGTLNIPDLAMRKEEVPVLSNVRIRLDPFPRTVVENNRSTGTPEGYRQHADQTDWLDYTI